MWLLVLPVRCSLVGAYIIDYKISVLLIWEELSYFLDGEHSLAAARWGLHFYFL